MEIVECSGHALILAEVLQIPPMPLLNRLSLKYLLTGMPGLRQRMSVPWSLGPLSITLNDRSAVPMILLATAAAWVAE